MYRLKASLAAARGRSLELWRVGPEYSYLVLKGDAVTKVSRIEKLVGSGEYAVLRGEAHGIKRAKIAPFLSDRPPPPRHQAGLRPMTAVFAFIPKNLTFDEFDELITDTHRCCARYEALLAKVVPFADRQACLVLLGAPKAHEDDPRRGVNLAVILTMEDRFEEALEIQRQCAGEYEVMGYYEGLFTALFNMAVIEVSLGDEERAIKDLEQSLAIARRIKNLDHVARSASILSYHLARQGRLEGVKELINESIRLYEEHNFDNLIGLVYAIRAYCDACTGDAESARRYLKLAEENPVEDSRPPLGEVVERVKARLKETDNE